MGLFFVSLTPASPPRKVPTEGDAMIPKNKELFSNLSDIERLFFDDEAYPWEALLKMIAFMNVCAGDHGQEPPLLPSRDWPPELRCIKDEERESSTPTNFMAIERLLHVRGGHRLKSDEGVHIRGPVVFGKDVILRKGVVITGPSFVGDRAVVGQGCRVKNSTIRADSEIQFGTRVAHAVIGSGVFIGPNAVLNDRTLNGNGEDIGYGEGVSTNMRHLGLIAGDRCKVGGGGIFVPGVILLPGTTVLEGVRLRRRAVYSRTVRDEFHDQ